MSNTCLGLGVEVLSRLEQRQEGLQWDNFVTPLSVDDTFNMTWVFGMLLIDAVVYMALSWFVSLGLISSQHTAATSSVARQDEYV